MSLIVELNGKKYLIGGSVSLLELAPDPAPIPPLPPVPDPPPVEPPPTTYPWPVLVPEPQPYNLPDAARLVQVANQSELDAAIASALAGDRIVLASGSYDKLRMASRPGGEPGKPVVFLATPDAKIGIVQFVGTANVALIGASVGVGGISINNAHHVDIVACDILTEAKACGVYCTNTPDNTGGFRFLNNRMRWNGPIVPAGYSQGAPTGIFFEMLRNVGDGLRIEGNYLDAWHDGISLGQMKLAVAAKSAVVRHNFISRCEDDFIEADGWFDRIEITDNVMGGTTLGALAGISAAPLGPTGPHLIARNSISGFLNLPLKLNNNIEDAETGGIDFTENVIVQVSDAKMCQYFPGPMKGVSGLKYHHNTMRARGSLYITEQKDWGLPGNVIQGFELDYNRLWSTREFNTADIARFLNVATNTNYYMHEFPELQAFGHEQHGVFAPMTVEPVAIPSVPGSSRMLPITDICRWKIS